MLGYLNAQTASKELTKVLVGLDFFMFNSFFKISPEMRESRFSLSAAKQYAKFLESKSSENTLLKRGSNSPPSIDENIKLWNQLKGMKNGIFKI